MKVWLRTIALAVALLVLVLAALQYRRSAALREQALAAAERGAVWLSALQIPLKDPGILWIISAIDGKYCHEPRVAQYVAQHFAEFHGRPNPIYPALEGLSLGKRDESFAAFSGRWQQQEDRSGVVSAMAYGVYCDRVPMPDDVAATLHATNLTRYDLTHQYLALLYMRQNGCLSAADEKGLGQVARAIAEEQREDPVFSDLWAERVAVLLYGDERGLVETPWLETLLAKQEPSGAWSDPKFPKRFYGIPENPHTTVLAVWALAEHSRACPF